MGAKKILGRQRTVMPKVVAKREPQHERTDSSLRAAKMNGNTEDHAKEIQVSIYNRQNLI